MTPAQVVGVALIASPFVALFIVAWRTMSLRVALGLYAATTGLVAVICAGVYLTTGSLS